MLFDQLLGFMAQIHRSEQLVSLRLQGLLVSHICRADPCVNPDQKCAMTWVERVRYDVWMKWHDSRLHMSMTPVVTPFDQ